MNPPKKCSRCGHADAVISMDCRRCHYVALVIVEVHKRFHPEKLEALSELLRKKNLATLKKECPENAYGNRAVYHRIQSLAYPAKIEEEYFKGIVADQIMREIGDIKGIANYDAKHGEGSWKRGASEYVGKCLRQAATTTTP